ncbi:MAG: S46 family peptidase, partial [Candidatus Acidiferrales bacterium]
DIVVLYAGGVFNLYRYKKYTDVRLVFSPEFAVAFYGGDPDNFTYPRYCLDISFFRVYENNQPARIEHYLSWNPRGIAEGDPVFVSGNPGSTGRQLTLAQMTFLRDLRYPWVIKMLGARLGVLRAFAAQGTEEERISRDTILSYSNSLKAITGYQSGLTNPELMARKQAAEQELRREIAADAAKQEKFGSLWDKLAEAQNNYATFHHAYHLLEGGAGLTQVRLFALARNLVRLPAETARLNEKRLREYRDSNLDSLKQELFSEAPVYDSLEKVMLTQLLTEIRDGLGADDRLVKEILKGRTPAQAAAAYVEGSSLKSVAGRKSLAEGGQAALEASPDTMIALARLVDDKARELRQRIENEVQAVERQNGSLLAEALFASRGTSVYPEATFTLRLSVGAAKGYVEDGLPRRWYTTFHGMYEREAGIDPYKLPARWLAAKKKLNLDTRFNFVSTNDIIGGNSGSPVVNRNGEFVGIIFDGNIQSLPNRFLYTDDVARAVSVHAAGIVEALRKVYGAGPLVNELKLVKPGARAAGR